MAAYFATGYFQQILEKAGRQSTRAYVGITRQKELPLMVPPIEVQTQFAHIWCRAKEISAQIGQFSVGAKQLIGSLTNSAFGASGAL